jgi:hypothetical protein
LLGGVGCRLRRVGDEEAAPRQNGCWSPITVGSKAHLEAEQGWGGSPVGSDSSPPTTLICGSMVRVSWVGPRKDEEGLPIKR